MRPGLSVADEVISGPNSVEVEGEVCKWWATSQDHDNMSARQRERGGGERSLEEEEEEEEEERSRMKRRSNAIADG